MYSCYYSEPKIVYKRSVNVQYSNSYYDVWHEHFGMVTLQECH